MSVWWNEVASKRTNVLTFVAKLRHCRLRIKEWCASNFYSISRTKAELATELHKLDHMEEQLPLNPDQLANRTRIKCLLDKVILEEESLWKARARQQWLKEEDGNTKFFHAVDNGRRRVNNIGVVEDEGRHFFGEEAKREYFYNRFKDIFAPSCPNNQSVGDWSNLIGSKPFRNPEQLPVPFSLDEIKKATFQLGGDKTPGPDGFNLRFY